GNAIDGTVLVVEHLGGGEAGEDLDPEGLGLFRQPAAQVAEADDVVAVVVHGLRHEQAGHFDAAGGAGEDVDVVAIHGGVEGSVALLPVGEQFVQGGGFEDRAGEDVGAHLGAFFHHADGQLGIELTESAGGGQPRWARADDDYIVLH